jgi:hypothetical protein
MVLGRLWPAGRQLDHFVLKHSLYACWGLPYCLVLRRLQRIRSMCADPLTCLRIMTGPVDTNVARNCSCTASDFAVWWPGLKNNPTVTHSCRKRRLKWVLSAWGNSWVTLSLGVINVETWSSRLGIGRWTNNPAQ